MDAQVGTAPPQASSVEAAFGKAFDEIQRRSKAAQTKAGDVAFFSSHSDDPCLIPWEIPDQEYVLLTMGTKVLAPRPLYPDRPALRVYGAFAEREEALEHSQVVRELDSKCSLVIVKRGEWVVMPIDETIRDSSDAALLKVNEKLEHLQKNLCDEKQRFDETVEKHVEMRPKLIHRDDPEEEREMKEAETLVYGRLKKLRSGAEVRGQSAVVMTVVPDEQGEALIKVLGCFETTVEANAWCRDVASRHVVDTDLMVVPACEWIYPNSHGQSNSKPQYRIDELQRIMDAAQKNVSAVKDYKVWKAEQDRLEAAERAEKSKAAEEGEAEDSSVEKAQAGEAGEAEGA